MLYVSGCSERGGGSAGVLADEAGSRR